jgi:hypothetical protein
MKNFKMIAFQVNGLPETPGDFRQKQTGHARGGVSRKLASRGQVSAFERVRQSQKIIRIPAKRFLNRGWNKGTICHHQKNQQAKNV